jgi:hypothetical protein
MGSGTRRTPSEEETTGATEQRGSPIMPGVDLPIGECNRPGSSPFIDRNQSPTRGLPDHHHRVAVIRRAIVDGWPVTDADVALPGWRPGLGAEFAADGTGSRAQRVEGGCFDGPFATGHDEP